MNRVVRPLKTNGVFDPHGDWCPITNKNQMLNDNRAVAQIVVMRVCLNRGEWWEDETIGFQIPEFLAASAKQTDINMLCKYIASYISNSYGVRGLVEVNAEYDTDRKVLVFKAKILSGETGEPVEVRFNGIL